MMKPYRNLLIYLILFLGIGRIKAQEPVQNLYSISFKQEFSSWSDCKNEPTFDYASIELYEIAELVIGYDSVIAPFALESINTNTDSLNKLIFFNYDFFIYDTSKSILKMVDSVNYDFSNIRVNAYINDISNDNEAEYYFYDDDLTVGENILSRAASDPCNNLISLNREGYTITTHVYIDDPVHVSNTNGIYRFSADTGFLVLNVGDFYNYESKAKPVFQVALSNSDDWHDLTGINVLPNSTLELDYSKIAGSKSDTGSNYYAWMGKNLKFRVVKTLMNGEKTFGQVVDGIVFYPEGLQFSILQTRRTSCDDNVSVYVKLEDGADKGYLNFDPNDYYWNATSPTTYFTCKMEEVTDSVNIFKISPKNTMPTDPFLNDTDSPITWLLQLMETIHPDNIACTKTFIIPPKPDSISISQIKGLYPINDSVYDVPDLNDPFVLLDIDDPYAFSYLRMPYVIKEGETVLDSINSYPNVYDEMSQAQKDSMDVLFESEFVEMVSLSNNPYRSYFETELKKLITNNPLGTQIPLPNNSHKYIFAGNSNFFLFENDGHIFKTTINNDGTYTTEQKTDGTVGLADIGGISPSSRLMIYSHSSSGGAIVSKAMLNTDGVNNGTDLTLPFSHSYDGISSLNSNPDIFFDNQNIIIGRFPNSGGTGLYKVNVSSGTVTTMYSDNALDPTLSKDNSFVIFRNSDGWNKGTISGDAVTDITEFCTSSIFTTSPDGSFALIEHDSKTYKIYLTGSQAGTETLVIPRDIDLGKIAFTNAGKCVYYYNGTYPNYEVDKGLYTCNLNGSVGTKIGSTIASDLTIAPNQMYIIYNNYTDTKTYKRYFGIDEATSLLYPYKYEANDWYRNYRVIYKQKWLTSRLGVKISNGIRVNQTQNLTLTDADGCEYPFNIYVSAPPAAFFKTDVLSEPSDACAKDGIIRITYKGGGLPPYVHSAGTLSTIGNSIIVSGIGNGDNPVYFYDTDGNLIHTLIATVASSTEGITGTAVTPQSCSTPNGTVTINVGNVTGSKVYKLTCDYPYKVYTATATANTYQFTGLPAGKYVAEVTSGTCYFTETDINVAEQVFQVKLESTVDATTIDGTGGVSLSFTNMNNSVYWVSGIPSVFRTSETTSSVSYTDVAPKTYNYVAQNIDEYGKTCNVSGSFTINKPSFTASINIEGGADSCAVLVSLTSGNSLITPFNFRLVNSSGELVSEGGNGNPLSVYVSGEETYTINLQYNTNDADIYSFSYPFAPIDISSTLTPPACPGSQGLITLSASGGIDGNEFLFSKDGLSFSTTNAFSVKGGVFTCFVKDRNTSYPVVSGNTLTINKSTINRVDVSVPEPVQVSAEKIVPVDVTCAGLDNGSVSIGLISGGSGYYQYLVDSGAWFDTTSAITGISTGSHTLYLRDSKNNCPAVQIGDISISQPDSLKFSEIDVRQSSCDTNNAFIRIAMTGGTTPYSYLWKDFYGNTVGTDTLISNLEQSGYYILDVTDLNGCTQHYEQAINPSNGPSIDSVEINHIKCFGDSTGSAKIVEIVPATPFAPWWLNWSDGSVSDSATGLFAGLHFVSVTDTNKCVYTRYFYVNSPEILQADVTDSRNACYGESDGFIQIESQGGVGGYTYLWSNGDKSNLADSIGLGSYSLQITDANQCQAEQHFTISQFDKVVADLGNDISICPGNSINLDGMDFTTHKWSTPEGIVSEERYISINSENDYYLEVTNDNGCDAYDTIHVAVGSDALKAYFIMTSAAYMGDTLYIFELSNMELDSLNWEYNPDAFMDVTDSLAAGYVLQLANSDTGIFNVKLLAYSGGCVSEAIKQVEIVNSTDTLGESYELGYNPLITSFTISPNPNEGTFNADISLREEADIELIIYSINYGEIVNDRFEYGLAEYNLSYSLIDLPTGVYIIILNAGNERKQVKMIIQQL